MTNTNQTYWDYYRDVCDELQDLIECDNSDGQGICDVHDSLINNCLNDGTEAAECAQLIADDISAQIDAKTDTSFETNGQKQFEVDGTVCDFTELIKANDFTSIEVFDLVILPVNGIIKGGLGNDIKRVK